ncbi:predicted protein [Arabidopsis lyrata subsp. lyrata]|uniref:Predicted protein n=1 Tax=Arabidopsis lyrata subsp. lyrata TaxID=81972 RepID=D7MLG7_ARALL|nr:predicted protein [Arabidopsis lyrata subsp. lyrata]
MTISRSTITNQHEATLREDLAGNRKRNQPKATPKTSKLDLHGKAENGPKTKENGRISTRTTLSRLRREAPVAREVRTGEKLDGGG